MSDRPTSEELKVIQEPKRAKTKQKHQKDSAILKEYIKNGYSIEQSADIMNRSIHYMYIIRKESIQNGTWLTPEELKAIQESKKSKKSKKSKTSQKHQEDLKTLKEHIKSGKSIKQAADLMKCSLGHAYIIRKESIQNGTWFNSEELKVSQEPEEWRIRHKRQEGDTYIKYRKAAKKEENLELAGKENVSTEGRREFIELLTTLNDSETNISDEDIELVVNAFYMHPEIANKSSIKFLISVANKKGDLKLTLNIVNELTNALQDTEFGNPLSEYRREIKKMEKLGITSAKWNGIFYNSKKPDFGDR